MPTRTRDGRLLTVRKRALVATTAGTILEWYDYALYAALSATLAPLFFPAEDATTSLLIILATLGVGFVFRPLGAVVLGRFGDRAGRKSMLAATIVIMGAASLLISVLPTFHQIGVLAPILLVVARIAQGFGAGAEWTGGAIYLVEFAPEGRKGLFGSIMQAANVSGFLLGVGVATLLVNVFSAAELSSYGWRIAFAAGGIAAVVGLLIRFKLDDTPEFDELKDRGTIAKSPLRETVTTHRREGLTIFGIACGMALYGYTSTTFPSFLEGVVEVPIETATATNTVALAVEVPLIVLAGWLSDRVGTRQLMTGAAIVFILGTYPLYLLLVQGSVAALLVGQICFVSVYALMSAPQAALYSQMLPPRTRATVLSSSYNISVALFGGTIPFFNSFLAAKTGVLSGPSIVLVAGAVVTLVALLSLRNRRTTKAEEVSA